MKLSDAQKIRAARAILGWNQKDVAEQSGVSINTVVNIEKEGHRAMHANRVAIFRALLEAGIGITDYGVFIRQNEKDVAQMESVGPAPEAGSLDVGGGNAATQPSVSTPTPNPAEGENA